MKPFTTKYYRGQKKTFKKTSTYSCNFLFHASFNIY